MITPHLDDNGEYGRTAWNGVSVPAMWSMLAAHDPARSATHETGWTMAAELLDDQYQRMLEYRILFVRTWPPGSSPAAARFLAVMDAMLAALDDARTAAVRNGPAISHISASLAEARTALRPVYEQWVSVHGGQGVPAPSGTAVPSPSPGPPPPNQVSARLQAQAADIMYTAGTRVLEGRDALVVPQPYKPYAGRDIGSDQTGVAQAPELTMSVPPGASGERLPMTHNRSADQASVGLSASDPVGHRMQFIMTPEGRQSHEPLGATSPYQAGGNVIGSSEHGIGRHQSIAGQTRSGKNAMEEQPPENGRSNIRPVRVNTSGIGSGISAERDVSSGVFGSQGTAIWEGQRRHRRVDRRLREDYWPVARGVPSVIEPPDEPDCHDPGPALGLHR